ELAGPFIGHGEQAADAARHRVLRHRRLREVAELVEARIAVAEAQLAGVAQVVGHLIAEDLERALDAGTGSDGRLRGTTQVGVVEVDEAVGGGAHLAALAQLLPRGYGIRGAHQPEYRGDRLALADADPVHAA